MKYRTAFVEQFWGIRAFKRHSLVLMVGGLAYMLTGVTYMLAPLTESRRIALTVALSWLPMEVWASVFVLAGIMAFISSRWPPMHESWGYMTLAGLSAGWAATYAAGVILDESPIGNLTGTLNWGLLAFLWWALPGFVNPDKTIVVVIKDDGHGSDS